MLESEKLSKARPVRGYIAGGGNLIASVSRTGPSTGGQISHAR